MCLFGVLFLTGIELGFTFTLFRIVLPVYLYAGIIFRCLKKNLIEHVIKLSMIYWFYRRQAAQFKNVIYQDICVWINSPPPFSVLDLV